MRGERDVGQIASGPLFFRYSMRSHTNTGLNTALYSEVMLGRVDFADPRSYRRVRFGLWVAGGDPATSAVTP